MTYVAELIKRTNRRKIYYYDRQNEKDKNRFCLLCISYIYSS